MVIKDKVKIKNRSCKIVNDGYGRLEKEIELLLEFENYVDMIRLEDNLINNSNITIEIDGFKIIGKSINCTTHCEKQENTCKGTCVLTISESK